MYKNGLIRGLIFNFIRFFVIKNKDMLTFVKKLLQIRQVSLFDGDFVSMLSIRQKTLKIYGLVLIPSVLFFGLNEAKAQSAACSANETLQTFTFAAPNTWPAGSATASFNLGAGVSAVTVDGTASLGDIVAGSPSTAASGGFADTFWYLVDRTVFSATNTVTFTFSKPVAKLRFVATDLDYNGTGAGAYQDRVTVVGAGPSGVVTPTAVAASALVAIAGNVATSTSTNNADNCAAGSNLCNATYSFVAPVTSITFSYGNGAGAFGNPPNQAVGIAAMGFCVQNPNLSLVKDDGGASFVAGATGTYTFTVNNVGSTGTSGTTTVKDVLPAGMSFAGPLTAGGANGGLYSCAVSTTSNVNDTATCTTTTAIAAGGTNVLTLPVAVASTVASGTTLTNRAKVFGGNDPNKATETTTGLISACASDNLAGNVANAGCGFETTPITATANLTLTKNNGRTTVIAGDAITYTVLLTNNGPSAASGSVLQDAAAAGLTKTGVVTCTYSGGAVGVVNPTIAQLEAGFAITTLPTGGAVSCLVSATVN